MLHSYADTYYSAIQNNRNCNDNKVQANEPYLKQSEHIAQADTEVKLLQVLVPL